MVFYAKNKHYFYTESHYLLYKMIIRLELNFLRYAENVDILPIKAFEE